MIFRGTPARQGRREWCLRMAGDSVGRPTILVVAGVFALAPRGTLLCCLAGPCSILRPEFIKEDKHRVMACRCIEEQIYKRYLKVTCISSIVLHSWEAAPKLYYDGVCACGGWVGERRPQSGCRTPEPEAIDHKCL